MNNAQGTLLVCEFFRSIAGETSFAGYPASFIRLSGCNLRCRWCDTERAWKGGYRVEVERAAKKLRNQGDWLVVITGGEPLLQPATIDLCLELQSTGQTVLIETNGSLPTDKIPKGVLVILDMKPPSSGEDAKMDFSNLQRMNSGDELKFVIADRKDFDWARNILATFKLTQGVNVLFSPASELLDPAVLAQWILQSRHQYRTRLQIQLHKILWPQGEKSEEILDE